MLQHSTLQSTGSSSSVRRSVSGLQVSFDIPGRGVTELVATGDVVTRDSVPFTVFAIRHISDVLPAVSTHSAGHSSSFVEQYEHLSSFQSIHRVDRGFEDKRFARLVARSACSHRACHSGNYSFRGRNDLYKHHRRSSIRKILPAAEMSFDIPGRGVTELVPTGQVMTRDSVPLTVFAIRRLSDSHQAASICSDSQVPSSTEEYDHLGRFQSIHRVERGFADKRFARLVSRSAGSGRDCHSGNYSFRGRNDLYKHHRRSSIRKILPAA
jgi:hypothetical protein